MSIDDYVVVNRTVYNFMSCVSKLAVLKLNIVSSILKTRGTFLLKH